MAAKTDLQSWVLQAVVSLGGSGTATEVAKRIWAKHEEDLRASGDLFFTWQYDMRWEAQKLRNAGILKKKHGERSGRWELS